jgi:hypothetical protein
MGQYDVSVLQLYPEHRIRKRLFYLSIDFYGFFLCQTTPLFEVSVDALTPPVNARCGILEFWAILELGLTTRDICM